MRRMDLKRDAELVAAEARAKTYSFWDSAKLPIIYERSFEGRMVQVRIDMLWRTDEGINLYVAVSGDNTTSRRPVCAGAWIENPEATKPKG